MNKIYYQRLSLIDKSDIDTVKERLARLANSICYNSTVTNGLQKITLFDNESITYEELKNAIAVLSKLVKAPTNDDCMPYILK